MSERIKESYEQGPEVNEAANERLEALEREKSIEKSAESKEKSVEKARAEVAEKVENQADKKAEKDKSTSSRGRTQHTISSKHKEASFKKHMTQVQEEMSAPSRLFSKFIHNKAVEHTSDFIGATIARPNAILSGSIAAFILVLAVYIIARSLGYVLSGFETIAAFIIGWILGAVYDYIKTLITGKSS